MFALPRARRSSCEVRLLLAAVFAALASTPLAFAQERAPKSTAAPPPSRRVEVKEKVHGVEIVDPYRWLEDQNSPDTREWIDAQNAYTEATFATVPGCQAIAGRLAELVKIDTIGMPTRRGNRYFFTRKLASDELNVLCMRDGLTGKDEVLIDPHPMSADHTTSVWFMGFARDGKLLAYGVRLGGEDETEIHLFDVDRREDLPDCLPKARYMGVSFLVDNKGFYYSKYDSTLGPRVYFHEMGAEPAKDREVFGSAYGPGKLVAASVTEDGRYLVLFVAHGAAASKTEIYFQNLEKLSPIVPLVNDVEATFSASFAGDRIVIETDWEAPNGRVLVADAEQPSREHWREVIPQSTAVIQSVSLAGGKLFVRYLENVNSNLRAFDLEGTPQGEIEFPAVGTVGGMSGEWRENEAFYTYSSYHIPSTIYRYDVAEGTSGIWWRAQVPVDSEKLVVKQVWFESKDKTRVPMFLVHAKDVTLDGKRPVYLTGYGGFRASQTPGFSATAVLWAERGGVFASPNLRGGGEFGEEWHRAGMLGKKQNVFDDFIAAAEWLIANKVTQPAKIAISGGSNGGLLVGAFMTQRPELCRAVLCSVPLLDMVRYHQFLVASFWVPEYGSSEDPEQFNYLFTYSPYHRVQKGGKYPAVMFVTGDSDTRVDPLHARKMCALMQWANASGRPVLLHYDTKSGHSGGKPMSKIIEDRAQELAFLLWQLGEV
ncbi:MAG: prolyl oligopeptidase family serine peptidase [Planctomycetota bacterium]